MPRGTSRYDEAAFQRRLWTPAHLRGFAKLYAWYDFSDRSTLTIASGLVTAVTDKSGFGVTATTPAADDPAYADPGIDFTNLGLAPLNATLPNGLYDFAAVATTRATAANYRVLLKNTTGSAAYTYIFEINTANVGCYDGAIKAVSGMTWPNGTLGQTWLSIRSITDLRYGLNGSDLQSPPAHSISDTSTIPDIGAQSGSSGRGFGTVYEVLFMPTTMPDHLRWKVEGYLAWKWSRRLVNENVSGLIYYYGDLVDRLPASHPYKRFPPVI